MHYRIPSSLAFLGRLTLGLASPVVLADSASSGVTFDVVYTGEPIRNLTGGRKTGGTYLDNLDLQLSADRGSIVGIPGISGLLYVIHNNSSEFSSDYAGDAQGVSNIDAPRGTRLYEAWLDWANPAGRISVRAGLYDLNSEFDSVETGGLFLNSSHGIGPDFSQTGLNGPSIFPVTSLALRVRTALGAGGYGQFALLDGVPGDPGDPGSNEIDLSHEDGALVVAELGWAGDDWRKLAVGAFTYTGDFARLADPEGPPDDGNAGWYAIADRTVWRRESTALAAFLRIGQAEERFNPFKTYVAFGASLAGFSGTRPDDELGLALAMARTGSDFKASRQLDELNTDSHETAIELTYRAPVSGWLTLQPDLQYIINPGTDPQQDNALTISLRFELSYSRSFPGQGLRKRSTIRSVLPVTDFRPTS